MRAIFSLWLVVLSFNCFSVWADKDFSSWAKYTTGTLVTETTAFAPGQAGTIGLKIDLVKHWHTYWINAGDSGVALRLKFKTDPGVKIHGVLFPFPERILTGPLISFAYSNQVLFPIEISLDKSVRPGTTVHVQVDAEWLVCSDVCIPALKTFHMDLPIRNLSEIEPGPEFKLFQKTRAMIPAPAAVAATLDLTKSPPELALPPLQPGESVEDFFPFPKSGLTNDPPKVEAGVLKFVEGNVASVGPSRIGVLIVKSDKGRRAIQFGESGWTWESDQSPETNYKKIFWMFLSAFIGGLILNLMPCVFPILSMKFLSLLKLGQAHSREVRQQNLAYVAGVLVSFLLIAIVLSALRSAGQWIGWGFQLQSPVFLAILVWLFTALSLNLLGVFEIDFFDSGMGGGWTKLGGSMGSFFTGVLAVIVASPCTAPFMGAALGFGLSQAWPVLFGIFFLLGLGLAFPYLLFAMFPAWTRFLPRPGVWMQTVKRVMALPMLATMLWMLWILSQSSSTTVMAVVASCAVVLSLSLIFDKWLLRGFAALVLLIGLGWVAFGSQPPVREAVQTDEHWIPFTQAKLDSLKGQNVFVDMTADWCLSCKVNERLVLDDAEVLARLKEKNVVLLRGDWTQRNEEITRFLSRYDRVGVPFYVFYSPKSPNGVALPEVLTKSTFIDWINSEFP